MSYLNAVLLVNKKLKINIYVFFYLIIGFIGCILIKDGIVKEKYLLVSAGLSFITVTCGLFFFLGYDLLEYGRDSLKIIYKIIGIISLVILLSIHLFVDIKYKPLAVHPYFLKSKYDLLMNSLACLGYVYVFVVRRVYKTTMDKMLSESTRLFIQIFLPLACYIVALISLIIGATFVILFLIINYLADTSFYKNNRTKKHKKQDIKQIAKHLREKEENEK